MAEPPLNQPDELLDVLTKSGEKTGVAKPRGLVHRDGDYHRAAHVWIYAETTQELLLQRRADSKDSWPGLWDISSAGHVTAGDTSLVTARRELDEELGISLPEDAFELIFLFLQECVINDGKYINNEYNDVYIVTTLDPIPLEAFTLQASFESFVGIRDDIATSQLKLFGDRLQDLEWNLPLDDIYKSKDVAAAPIRVIRLLYNAGDVGGPQTVAFNLPNDERIVKERGTSMTMLKNVSEAKFKLILKPIADICINEEQREYIDFESFYTHTVCHECCHGIGPHTITLPSGQQSTVRLELQEFHSALEEAKADIVGLWALRFLIYQELLPESLLKSMYVSFLAGCFRSIRFGLEEAHGKGQALIFNWLYEKKAFPLHSDGTFSVDFLKVEGAVESLCREILTTQAKGDKASAKSLLERYVKVAQPLRNALEKLERVQVPVDIIPTFEVVKEILEDKV